MLAPLLAVLVFLAAIVAAFGYLRLEEMEREQEEVRHDVEYAQQRLRLSLLERQETLGPLTVDMTERPWDLANFRSKAEGYLRQNSEIERLSWVTDTGSVRASVSDKGLHSVTSKEEQLELEKNIGLVRVFQKSIYAIKGKPRDGNAVLEIYLPLNRKNRLAGVLLAEYSIETIYWNTIVPELSKRYAISMLDVDGKMLAGREFPKLNPATRLLPWVRSSIEYEIPVAAAGNQIRLRAQGYRTSLGLVGNGLFWLVVTLSVISAWMLIANWRHNRSRMQTQKALIAETNFRRAMENSMPTGMRAMDLKGHITYVNTAFCQMTGWSEEDLVGSTPPFPYWPEEDRDMMMSWLDDELNGRITAGGLQVRVKRKNGTLFDARFYVSPLIDAFGKQTGWMTSMTDITEPNRIREQLFASYERFTTVLDGLDTSVSVVPSATEAKHLELLFANTLYKEWFGTGIEGHLQLAQYEPPSVPNTSIQTSLEEGENAEVYVESLDKWLELRIRYLTWVDGRLVQMVIASDITPRRLAEEQAATQAERAQTASRLITMGEMASGVAHELNQPLTAISNYCNGLVSRIKSKRIADGELVNVLEKTMHQAQRAGQIILRIRSFVKRSQPNRTLSDINHMVEEAVELAEIGMRRHNVRLLRHISAHLPPLMVDPILIEQVLINLLKNAAESVSQAKSTQGPRLVELSIDHAAQDGRAGIEFSVCDNGIGIQDDAMERMFEPFYTTKTEGMGIGLSLCRSIIESHLGRLTARNLYNAGQITGCCFSFWLPLPEAESQLAPPVEQPIEKVSG